MEPQTFNFALEVEELNSRNNPAAEMLDEEFDDLITKFGTFIFLITKKSISPSSLFISIVSDKYLSGAMMRMAGMDSLMVLYNNILIRYPNLSKSKMLKRELRNH